MKKYFGCVSLCYRGSFIKDELPPKTWQNFIIAV